MKVTIDENVCLKYKLSLTEVLAALSVKTAKNYEEMIENLFNRGILVQDKDKTLIAQPWIKVINEILCDSSGEGITDERVLNLAKEMRAVYPKGKMKDRLGRDTPYYFSCNNTEVMRKLKKFFKEEGNYSDEEILDATRRYVAYYAKKGYAGMRLIKYFIWKDDVKLGEDGNHVEPVSDLATYLSNKDEPEDSVVVENTDDWMMNVRS